MFYLILQLSKCVTTPTIIRFSSATILSDSIYNDFSKNRFGGSLQMITIKREKSNLQFHS